MDTSLSRFDQCIGCMGDTGWHKWYGIWLIEGRGMMGCICTECHEKLKDIPVPEEERDRALDVVGRFPASMREKQWRCIQKG